MQGKVSTHLPSDCGHHRRFIAEDNGLGALFRTYGEEYISRYRPDKTQIKLIRSIRLCRTPALGGKRIYCKDCKKSKYIYFSCGNSRCPKCQGIKRMQWQDRLSSKLLDTPYLHMVFTMPHELNRLAKTNPFEMYNCLMRSSWEALKECCADECNLGGLPGAVMVLHTFGSDLKYHCHVHALVTFGGLDEAGKWVWPKRRNKLVAFRQMRAIYRKTFLKNLKKLYSTIKRYRQYDELHHELMQKSWCVHAEPPTANTKTITEYLSKYINRIGLSVQRFHYNAVEKSVTLSFKDYKKQKSTTEKPPMAVKTMHPLVAINQILAHSLPPYFQKCRYYGLHASTTRKKYRTTLKDKVRRNGLTIRKICQIIKSMLGIEIGRCEDCGSSDIQLTIFSSDRKWKNQWLGPVKNKGTPNNKWTRICPKSLSQSRVNSMSGIQEIP